MNPTWRKLLRLVPSTPPEEVKLDIEDIENLVAHGFLVEIRESEVRSWCRSFNVVEEGKGRRRWILHPHLFNDATENPIGEEEAVPFPRPEDICKKVPKYRLGVPLDFSWFFGQFPTATGNAMTIMKGDRFFAPTTIATGARQPPLFAQLLTLAIVMKTCSTVPGSDGDAYIDNVRLLANSLGSMQTLVCNFFDTVQDIGITVNEKLEDVLRLISTDDDALRNYIFLGLQFDHVAKTVQLGRKTLKKTQ
jgi:hypothetical protein